MSTNFDMGFISELIYVRELRMISLNYLFSYLFLYFCFCSKIKIMSNCCLIHVDIVSVALFITRPGRSVIWKHRGKGSVWCLSITPSLKCNLTCLSSLPPPLPPGICLASYLVWCAYCFSCVYRSMPGTLIIVAIASVNLQKSTWSIANQQLYDQCQINRYYLTLISYCLII